ncbi:DUF3859 domain-containing protein [Oceanicola sp. D3]|uniref:DUF3859 domain-containing protein n=1 Tax=Oceanicola sp. D3 TaxID=2587163 RepID=UPI001AEF3B7C|nr:DUF3859 domain-containing protein [Oceanicola sp. D3]
MQADSTVIERLEFGLTCPLPIVSSKDAPGTENGRVDIFEGEAQFVDSHQQVPAVLGVGFGVKAWAHEGATPMAITIRSLHPAFPGTGTTSQSFASHLGPEAPMTHIFTFDAPHEATPGLWQLQALQGQKLIYSVSFQVVPPAAYTGPPLDCEHLDLLSATPHPAGPPPA